MSRPYYFTARGLERLRARVRAARAAYREVCDDNPAALESGDSSGWHDNFAFEENQRQMHQLARHVRDLEATLSRARVVPSWTTAPDAAYLGTSIVYRFVDEAQTRSAWIAGWDDGDPESGRLSYNSPLGASLLGAAPGDEREVTLGGVVRRLELIEVGPTPPDEQCPGA